MAVYGLRAKVDYAKRTLNLFIAPLIQVRIRLHRYFKKVVYLNQ